MARLGWRTNQVKELVGTNRGWVHNEE